MENFLSCFRLAQCYVTINSAMTLYFSAVKDSERRKRQHLKKSNAVVRQTREQTSFRAYNEDGEESSNQSSVSDTMPYSY